MKIITLVFLFVLSLSQAVESQTVSENLYIEYRNETAGDNIDTIKLFKKGNVYKLYHSGKFGVHIALIDYSLNEYTDIAVDKGTKGNRFSPIDYNMIVSMWKIYFNGLTPMLKQYVKLPEKQSVTGKECDVYDSGKLSIMNSTIQYFFYGDLMLKMEKPGHVIEAVKFDENPVFTEEDFSIPGDVSWLYDYRKK